MSCASLSHCGALVAPGATWGRAQKQPQAAPRGRGQPRPAREPPKPAFGAATGGPRTRDKRLPAHAARRFQGCCHGRPRAGSGAALERPLGSPRAASGARRFPEGSPIAQITQPTHFCRSSESPCRFFPNVFLAAKTFMGRGLGPKNNVGSAPVSIFSFFDPGGLLPCWVRG